MNLNKVTITGVDDETPVKDLHALWIKYPFVEWGVLFSASRAGTPKYPTTAKIMTLTPLGMSLSAHFCGEYAREVLEAENGFIMFTTHLIGFERIQLNYDFLQSPIRWSFKAPLEFNRKFPKAPLILQYNKFNEGAVQKYLQETNARIHVLYDSSGGKGLNTAEVADPFPVYTGYSGGLGPDNVEEFVKRLLAHPKPGPVWIDMENNVRTGDELDLDKVARVLEICSKFMAL